MGQTLGGGGIWDRHEGHGTDMRGMGQIWRVWDIYEGVWDRYESSMGDM